MRIGLIGGIFGDRMEDFAKSAPEIVLTNALRRNGHEVITFPLSSCPEADVDVYHAHHFGPAAYYLALRQSKPLVFTPHNGFLINDYPHPTSFVEVTLMKMVFHRADRVVALSQTEAGILQKRYGLNPCKMTVIPNGLNIDLYHDGDHAQAHRESKPFRLLTVGQLQPFKGHRYLLEALSQIVPAHPEVELRIITHNPARLRDDEEFIEQHGLKQHIVIAGSKSTEELVEFYAACDVYVQPSLVDCFPVTVMEAMACGRPVVATDVGGVREQLAEGAGIVVPPADVAALAKAITYLIENPEASSQHGRQARQRALALFGRESLCAEHLKVYERVLEERTNRPLPGVPRAIATGLMWLYIHRNRFRRFAPRRFLWSTNLQRERR